MLPAVHLSFSAGTSIPVSNSFCHFPSKKAALVSVVPPSYLHMTHTNAGHGKAELLSEVQEAGLKFFLKKDLSTGKSSRQDETNKEYFVLKRTN